MLNILFLVTLYGYNLIPFRYFNNKNDMRAGERERERQRERERERQTQKQCQLNPNIEHTIILYWHETLSVLLHRCFSLFAFAATSLTMFVSRDVDCLKFSIFTYCVMDARYAHSSPVFFSVSK